MGFAAAGLCAPAVGFLLSGTGPHTVRTGDLLMLAAAAVRAGRVALVGRLSAGRSLRPLHLTAVQTLAGSVLFAAPSTAHLGTLAHSTASMWAQLVYLDPFCGLFAFLSQTWAVQRTSASRASLLLGTEPVWAVAVGIGLGGERLTVLSALGASLMAAATYWGQAIERAHRTGPERDTTVLLTAGTLPRAHHSGAGTGPVRSQRGPPVAPPGHAPTRT